MPIALSSWEKNVIWDESDVTQPVVCPILAQIQESERGNQEVFSYRSLHSGIRACNHILNLKFSQMSIFPVRNSILDCNEWLKNWDDEEWDDLSQTYIHDPTLLLPSVHEGPSLPEKPHNLDPLYAIDQFNLSNDHFYVVQKKTDNTRSSNQVVLQHAPPALRLVSAFVRNPMIDES
jgi:hypothetical protein